MFTNNGSRKKHVEQVLSLHGLSSFSGDPAGKTIWLGLCNMLNGPVDSGTLVLS